MQTFALNTESGLLRPARHAVALPAESAGSNPLALQPETEGRSALARLSSVVLFLPPSPGGALSQPCRRSRRSLPAAGPLNSKITIIRPTLWTSSKETNEAGSKGSLAGAFPSSASLASTAGGETRSSAMQDGFGDGTRLHTSLAWSCAPNRMSRAGTAGGNSASNQAMVKFWLLA
jgi:hypothetical protein